MSETPDLTFYRLVHRAMRTSSRQLHRALSVLGVGDGAQVRRRVPGTRGLSGRASTKKQMLFTVPWFVSKIDDEERAYIFGTVPAALRIPWRLTRRGYARRASVAFGSPLEAVLA